MEKEIEDYIKQHKQQEEYYEGEQFDWYMNSDNVIGLIELVKNLNKPVVINQRELLIAYELKVWINPTAEMIANAEKLVDMYLNN